MFDENKHPRDKDGKFTNGSSASRENYTQSVNNRIKWAKENGVELPLNADGSVDDIKLQEIYENSAIKKMTPASKASKSKSEFYGIEFTGVKGAEAIEKLLKEKCGHVKNAFERPEIGGIDLVWGDDSGGLKHTILRRDEQLKQGTGRTSGIDITKKIPEIIEKGKFSLGAGDRPNFTYNDYLVVIKPAFDGERVNWVVTAMEPQIKLDK